MEVCNGGKEVKSQSKSLSAIAVGVLQARSVHGKSEQPSAAVGDSQSVKVTSKGGSRASCNAAGMAPNA